MDQDASAARDESASEKGADAWAAHVAARYDADGASAFAITRLILGDDTAAGSVVLEAFLHREWVELSRARLLLHVCRAAFHEASLTGVKNAATRTKQVNLLPADEREALALCLQRVRCSEIAEIEGVPTQCIVLRLHRALDRIQKMRTTGESTQS